MFVTVYGSFNGSTWEGMCQILFKRKYMADDYQTVKASPGDYGIEGFTRTGNVFQCYCPEVNLDNATLYNKQRDKITEDISKLNLYKNELPRVLGSTKIKKWILVTPRMGHHNLLSHCHTKSNLVKSWGLSFIDADFDVLVHEADDYALEIGEYFSSTGRKFTIKPEDGATEDDKLISWKTTSIDLIQNALLKNKIRINSMPPRNDPEKAINALTDSTVRHHLNGESILRKWEMSQPENHQRFIELLVTAEEELRDKCILNEADPNSFVAQTTSYIESKIKESFNFLDESSIMRLKNYCISTWILRCPLYFEISQHNI